MSQTPSGLRRERMRKRSEKLQISVYLDRQIADVVAEVAKEYNNSMSGAGEYVMKLGAEVIQRRKLREAQIIAMEREQA